MLQGPKYAIVKLQYTTICGTELHILNGDSLTTKPGTALGRECVGTIEEIGAGMSNFKKGGQVLISCISSCGRCEYCRRNMYSHCQSGGWVLGNTINGTQAEYVQIPVADSSLYKVPKSVDAKTMVMLFNIFPTAFECSVINEKVQPGPTVCIFGSAPTGLAALLTAQLYSPAWVMMITPTTIASKLPIYLAPNISPNLNWPRNTSKISQKEKALISSSRQSVSQQLSHNARN